MSNAIERLQDDLANALSALAQERARRAATETEAATESRSRQCRSTRIAFRGADHEAEAGDRKGSPRTLRQPVGAQGAAPGADELQFEELEAHAGEEELAAKVSR